MSLSVLFHDENHWLPDLSRNLLTKSSVMRADEGELFRFVSILCVGAIGCCDGWTNNPNKPTIQTNVRWERENNWCGTDGKSLEIC